MGGEWHKAPFAKLLIEPVRNGIYKKKHFHGRGAKIVNMGELFAHPRLRAVPMKRVELNESETRRFLLTESDLIFARRSLTAEGAGKCSVVLELDEPTTFESSIIRARPNTEKADSLYLYYFFNSPSGFHSLDTIRRQVAVAGITGGDLAKLEIPVPPLSEQRAIAHILGTLDDKIELNRRRNQTLEAMAGALFKDWFIDFGPVRRNAAKAQNQPSPGLRPPSPSGSGFENTAHEPPPSPPGRGAGGEGVIEGQTFDHLFPDRLDDEGKPEGWRSATLANFASLNPESWTKKNAPHEIRYVDLSNTKQGTIEGAARMPWSEAPSRAQRILRPGDTIVGTVRPGNKSFALIGGEGMTGSTGFAVLRPLEKDFRDFVFLAATSPENIERLTHLADGAAYPAVRPDVVLASPVTVPPGEVVSDVLHGFANAVSCWLDSIEHNKQESQTLAQLRDTLLPKLMSGQVRVDTPFNEGVQ